MASINGLDSYFTNLISNLMVLERQPVTRMAEQKDALARQKGVYSDLKSKFDGLQDALNALRSTHASYNLKTGRKAAVTPPTGSTVVTATVGAEALAANYTLSVTQLAKAHTARSDVQASSDQDLGKTGKILLGGTATRSQTRNDANLNTVAGFDVSASLVYGQKELGNGNYFVETRYDTANSKWQFRLVDAEGKAQSIRQGASDSVFTNDWQEFTESQVYDSGRGLKITFAGDDALFQTSDRLNGAASTAYAARGLELEIKADMSLIDIAGEINKLKFAEGNEITASIIDHRLVFQAGKSGATRTMIASDTESNFLQSIGMLNGDNATFKTATAGQNSIFTVNNVQIVRSANTALTDVLAGVSLNLAGDAEGKTATLSVTTDTSGARNALNAFVTKYNELQNYLKAKTAVNKGADGKYTREALAGDVSLKSASSDLHARFTATATNTGAFTALRQIGIDLDSDLTAKVTDATKLDDALNNRLSDVQLLVDAVMGNLNSRLSSYSGDTGYAATARKSTETQIESLDDRITGLNEQLAKTQERYTNQYAEIQAQLLQMTYMSQQWSSIYSFSSKLY
jgi:flagellar hook-associated protein 2